MAAALAATVLLVVLDLRSGLGPRGLDLVLQATAGLAFAGGGVVALRHRPESGIGLLMLGCAAAWFAEQIMTVAQGAAFFTAQLMISGLWSAFLIHIVLGFPSGRPTTPLERATVAAAYLLTSAWNLVVFGFLDTRAVGAPPNLLLIADAPSVADAARVVDAALLLLLVCGLLVAVALRRRRAAVAERRALAPVQVAGIALALSLAGYALTALDVLGGEALFNEYEAVAAVLVPIAFVIGLLRWRLARAELGGLVLELERVRGGEELRAALARALGDPSVEIAYRRAECDRWVDRRGHTMRLPRERDRSRAVAAIGPSDEPVAALLHDRELLAEPSLVASVCAAAGMALENERLRVELLAQLEEVRASRVRIVEAADAERRRIERNLHDGAQQRLLSLAMALRLAARRGRDGDRDEVEDLLGEAQTQLADAIAELRGLAHGLHPTVLAEDGLAPAIDALAERAPLPVRIAGAPEERLPERVEVAAYYVVCEALANAAKHSNASLLEVTLERSNGLLRVEVSDDGRGGAVGQRGSGLEGLTDRVHALNGYLELDSPPGGGTRVRAQIPCA